MACGLLPRAARGRSILALCLDKNSLFCINLQIKCRADICVCMFMCEECDQGSGCPSYTSLHKVNVCVCVSRFPHVYPIRTNQKAIIRAWLWVGGSMAVGECLDP